MRDESSFTFQCINTGKVEESTRCENLEQVLITSWKCRTRMFKQLAVVLQTKCFVILSCWRLITSAAMFFYILYFEWCVSVCMCHNAARWPLRSWPVVGIPVCLKRSLELYRPLFYPQCSQLAVTGAALYQWVFHEPTSGLVTGLIGRADPCVSGHWSGSHTAACVSRQCTGLVPSEPKAAAL